MTNNKWTKWLIGLSSVALFTGFVGFASKNSELQTATDKTSSAGQTDQTSTQDELSNQWQSDDQSSTSAGTNDNTGSAGSSVANSGGVTDQNNGSQGSFSGRMRTQGS